MYKLKMNSSNSIYRPLRFETFEQRLMMASLQGLDNIGEFDNPGIVLVSAKQHSESGNPKSGIWVDIDTDSDNTGIVDRSDVEDIREHHSAINNSVIGKRIFLNIDDDNSNGVPDLDESIGKYDRRRFLDNDLARIEFSISDEVAELGSGYQVTIKHGSGLRIFSEADRSVFKNGDGKESIGRYEFVIGKDELPSYAFVEGITVSEPDTNSDNHDVIWEVEQTNPTHVDDLVSASDAITFSVEPIVWPFTNQTVDWQNQHSSEWNGLELGRGWYIDKALEDYLIDPDDKGTVESVHPNCMPWKVHPESRLQSCEEPSYFPTVNKELSETERRGTDELAKTTKSFGPNVVVDLEYGFESRGVYPNGYVHVIRSKPKLSFVGNSGIKYVAFQDDKGKNHLSKDNPDATLCQSGSCREFSILDMSSLVSLATNTHQQQSIFQQFESGITLIGILLESQINKSSNELAPAVKSTRTLPQFSHPFVLEGLTSLMTGVRYGESISEAFKDFTPKVKDDVEIQDYVNALKSNHKRAAGLMKLEFKHAVVQSYLNNQLVYEGVNDRVADTRFYLQSHWGSGVVFDSMNIDLPS